MYKPFKDNEKLAFEAWKYYKTLGGSDKDRMIQIVSLLLGFSTAIIGFYVKGEIKEEKAECILLFSGILVSLLAVFVVCLYGSYATWNWFIAYQIAHEWEWFDANFINNKIKNKIKKRLIKYFAKPRIGKFAPVFIAFLLFSIVFVIIYAYLLYSLLSLCIWIFTIFLPCIFLICYLIELIT